MQSYLEQSVPAGARPMEIELIRSMVRGTATKQQKAQFEKMAEAETPESKAFIVKRASQWLQTDPYHHATRKLFGDFWYEGELCILFADTNVGKSILAVQIADSLSRGGQINGFENELPPGPVLYFDFELNAAQFTRRYCNANNNVYRFHSNLFRVELDPDAPGSHKFKNYADYINNALENLLIETGAQAVIIDNLSCLRSGTEAATTAISLMRGLQAIKNRYQLSILALAHTPKRNPARAITRNDLQGSKMLMNFADSAFAIGESHTQPGLRYLKQIKQRSGGEIYGPANVCLFRIEQPGNFLHIALAGVDAEAAHLLHPTDQQRRQTEEFVLQRHAANQSVRKISMQTGLSRSAIHRIIKRLGASETEESTG